MLVLWGEAQLPWCASMRVLSKYAPSRASPCAAALQEYSPPTPARGKHRLLFLLYKQNGRVAAKAPAKRQGFQVPMPSLA